jgi:hypothetical protein
MFFNHRCRATAQVVLLIAVVAHISKPLFASDAEAPASKFRLEDIPFDGRQAYEYLKQICAIGPRPSGSAGMAIQQRLVADHFRRLGAHVGFQEFSARNPRDDSQVPMANMIVQWHPDRTERILLCTHYDTRPYPDKDARNPMGILLGADDGASGVALLMELGKWMPRLESRYGVDFVLFDGSQFVSKEGTWKKEGDPRFLGADHFARLYATDSPPCKYRKAVLLDMIGNEDLEVYQEFNSMSWRDTRPLVDEIWQAAYRIGVREFVPTRKHSVADDHLKVHDVGKIPTCAIIDFDYAYWRTEQDTPFHCSPLALAKVGWVMLDWLAKAK